MKKHFIVSYFIILALMSSCGVYSLFPIYTKDTLVERKEIMGKWLSDQEGSYLTFGKISYTVKPGTKKETFEMDGMTVTFSGGDGGDVIDTGDYVIEKGDTTIWKDTIRTQFSRLIQKKIDQADNISAEDLTAKSDSFYYMKFYEDNELAASYKAHLVRIGEDYFIDMLPQGGIDKDNGAADNYLPVHTFMKFKLENNNLELKMFDQTKLKDLFKSNLIRLRHEVVEDKILITAQPKEIQKFLEKYSRDESVFEDILSYKKANS